MPHTIEDVAHRLRENKKNGDSCVLLIGAGCSVSADIPLPAKFVSIIKDEFPREYERASVKDYPHCMGELTPTQRHRLISRYIDKAKINWAHIAIAQLMAGGFVDRVLTTNFDPLVMRACALFNIFPAVHDMVSLGEYRASRVRDKAVFYLHGQGDSFFQAHVKRDVEELEAKLAPLFQDCVNRRTWIVVGYSGDNDPVFRQLLNMRDFDHDLYWIGYRDAPMPPLLAPLMEEGRGGHWIDGWDADNFLYQLAAQVGCPEPPFFASPFTHLRQTLDSIASFKLPGQDTEVAVTQDAIAKIDQAIFSGSHPPQIVPEGGNVGHPFSGRLGLTYDNVECRRVFSFMIYTTWPDTQGFSGIALRALHDAFEEMSLDIIEDSDIQYGSIYKKFSVMTKKALSATKLRLAIGDKLIGLTASFDGSTLNQSHDPNGKSLSALGRFIKSVPEDK